MSGGFKGVGGLGAGLFDADFRRRLMEDLSTAQTGPTPDFAASPALSPSSNAGRLLLADHVTLSPRGLTEYAATFTRLLRAAQLGDAYVDSEQVCQHIEALVGLVQAGRIPGGVTLHGHSGLPDRGAWLTAEALGGRTWKAQGHASAQVDDLFEREGSNAPRDSADRTRRLRAAEQLEGRATRPIENLDVQVVDYDRKTQTRTFRVSYDALVEPSLVQRVTLEVRQTGDGDRKAPLRRTSSGWALKDDLRHALERDAALSFELQFARFEQLAGDALQGTSRGQMGPFWTDGVSRPTWVDGLMRAHPGSVIAQFSIERFTRRDTDRRGQADGWTHSREAVYSATADVAPAVKAAVDRAPDAKHVRVVGAS